jgi:hypothetical protein
LTELEESMERPSTHSPRPIRLVEGHPIYLTSNGIPGEKELASAFRSAWRLVPPAARRTILGYWYTPTVEVVDDLPADRPGEVRCYGLDIRFLGPACAAMPASACIGLVLLQLAHVYRCARSEYYRHTLVDDTGQAQKLREGNAIGTVAFDWGLGLFSCALRNWTLGRGEPRPAALRSGSGQPRAGES